MTNILNDKELSILESVSFNAAVSQRELSRQIGLSLGVTNNLLQKLIRDELLSVRQTNKKRREYHLTDRGQQQKNSHNFFYVLKTMRAYRELERFFTGVIAKHVDEGVSEVIIPQRDEIADSLSEMVARWFGDRVSIKRLITDSHEKSLLLRFGNLDAPVNFKGRVLDLLSAF